MNAHTETYKGYTINIEYDQNVENPFLNWDGEGSIIFHPDAKYECNTSQDFFDACISKYAIRLDAYIHSGFSLSVNNEGFNCKFDTSKGIAVFIPDMKNHPAKDKKHALELARQACKLYNKYANGEVYGYIVEDKKENLVDSCFGFYGDIDYCIKEAKNIINCQVEENKQGMKIFHALG